MNKRQKLFADKYLSNGMNAKKAYLEVYNPTTCADDPTYCYTLLKKPEVQEYIEKRRNEVYDSLNIDAIRTMTEIADIAFADCDETITIQAKLKALELLSKNLSLQTIKAETKDVIEVTLLEDEND